MDNPKLDPAKLVFDAAKVIRLHHYRLTMAEIHRVAKLPPSGQKRWAEKTAAKFENQDKAEVVVEVSETMVSVIAAVKKMAGHGIYNAYKKDGYQSAKDVYWEYRSIAHPDLHEILDERFTAFKIWLKKNEIQ